VAWVVRRGKIPAHWGKFCAGELAVALARSRRAAERMAPLAHDLAVRLPETARARQYTTGPTTYPI